MSLYTTGELAKLCNVSVRTVQYYDTRNILKPSALSEGGRRLYSEEDVKRMEIICFLREAGISLSSIEELISEKEPGKVISILLEQQEMVLAEEVEERQRKLELLIQMKKELKNIENFSVESISDIAYVMENKKKLQKLHAWLLIVGLPINILQWGIIIYGIATGIWWPALIYVFVGVPYGFWISSYYFKRVAYVCPECHTVFKPNFKEAVFANHTPTLRKLTCTCCGYKGFCVETYGKEEK
ncbi:MAG: MerR family transcriptional regulator [Agathobacter sp.]|nr:MerR family transcriptional regulator [Agathobacter sp.]